MGLAASQCRLLSINSRLANLELRSQQLSNQKVALSTASTNASNKYIRALNNEYINIYDENGNYQQATANLLTNYGAQTAGDQLFLQNDLGQILCSNSVLDAFNLSNGNLEAFLRAAGGCTSTGNTSVLSSVAGTTAMELDAIANMAKQLKVNDELLAPDTGLAANFSNIQNAVSSVYKQGNDVYNLEQYHNNPTTFDSNGNPINYGPSTAPEKFETGLIEMYNQLQEAAGSTVVSQSDYAAISSGGTLTAEQQAIQASLSGVDLNNPKEFIFNEVTGYYYTVVNVVESQDNNIGSYLSIANQIEGILQDKSIMENTYFYDTNAVKNNALSKFLAAENNPSRYGADGKNMVTNLANGAEYLKDPNDSELSNILATIQQEIIDSYYYDEVVPGRYQDAKGNIYTKENGKYIDEKTEEISSLTDADVSPVTVRKTDLTNEEVTYISKAASMAALAVATRIIEDSRIYSQDGIYDANGDIVQGTYTLNGTTSTVDCPNVSWYSTYANSAFSDDQIFFNHAEDITANTSVSEIMDEYLSFFDALISNNKMGNISSKSTDIQYVTSSKVTVGSTAILLGVKEDNPMWIFGTEYGDINILDKEGIASYNNIMTSNQTGWYNRVTTSIRKETWTAGWWDKRVDSSYYAIDLTTVGSLTWDASNVTILTGAEWETLKQIVNRAETKASMDLTPFNEAEVDVTYLPPDVNPYNFGNAWYATDISKLPLQGGEFDATEGALETKVNVDNFYAGTSGCTILAFGGDLNLATNGDGEGYLASCDKAYADFYKAIYEDYNDHIYDRIKSYDKAVDYWADGGSRMYNDNGQFIGYSQAPTDPNFTPLANNVNNSYRGFDYLSGSGENLDYHYTPQSSLDLTLNQSFTQYLTSADTLRKVLSTPPYSNHALMQGVSVNSLNQNQLLQKLIDIAEDLGKIEEGSILLREVEPYSATETTLENGKQGPYAVTGKLIPNDYDEINRYQYFSLVSGSLQYGGEGEMVINIGEVEKETKDLGTMFKGETSEITQAQYASYAQQSYQARLQDVLNELEEYCDNLGIDVTESSTSTTDKLNEKLGDVDDIVASYAEYAKKYLGAVLSDADKATIEGAIASLSNTKDSYDFSDLEDIVNAIDTIKNTVMKHAAGFDDKVSISSDPNVVKYWTNVFNALQKNGSVAISDDKLNSPDWLQEQLTIGNITIARQEEDGSLAKKQYNTSLSYVAIDKMGDEVIALAQAEYEAEVNRIARKEKKIDNELACIETEHSALEQQKESIKAVQEHNIEKGFQLFS